jgi:hypothetical protein
VIATPPISTRSTIRCVEQTRLAGIRPPDQHHRPALANDAAGAAVTRELIQLIPNRPDSGDRLGCGNEMEAFVGIVQRRLEFRGQIEQLGIDARDGRGERAFELIHRRARLQGRHRVHEVRHGLRLRQVQPSAQVRAQREFPRLSQPRALRHRQPDDPRQQQRTAMRADFDDVLARIGMRRGEPRRDDLIDDGSIGRIDQPGECRMSRFEGRDLQQRARDTDRRRAGQPDDADAAPAGRCGNRDDGVVGSEAQRRASARRVFSRSDRS